MNKWPSVTVELYPSFIKIGPVVLENNIFKEIVDGRQPTDNGHKAITIGHLEHFVLRSAKQPKRFSETHVYNSVGIGLVHVFLLMV